MDSLNGQYNMNFAAPLAVASAPISNQSVVFTDNKNNPLRSTTTLAKSPSFSSKDESPLPNLNPRSCTTCRRRKVRCDKRHPCSNCQKAGIECVFPGPGRAPRRSKKPPDTELLARLRRLEGVVQSLGKGANGEDLVQEGDDNGIRRESTGDEQVQGTAPTAKKQESNDKDRKRSNCPKKHREHKERTVLDKDFGRLVIEQGRSRYVSNGFWTSLTEEVSSGNT